MFRPALHFFALSTAALLAAAIAPHASAQAAYKPPRTAEGKPDLQGVWTNASLTTLERNSKYPSLTLDRQGCSAEPEPRIEGRNAGYSGISARSG